MKTKTNKLKLILFKLTLIFCLPVAILFSATLFYAYNHNFYKAEFQQYELDAYVGITMDEMEIVSFELIKYIQGELPTLDEVTVTLDGENRPFFNQREKDHMKDVVIIFNQVQMIRNIIFGLIGLFTIWLVKKDDNKKDILKAYGYGGIATVVVCGLIILGSTLDFSQYFTLFHKVAFSNDLWLLNPKTDMLIRMLPLEFFIDIVTKIILYSALTGVALTGFGFWGSKKISENQRDLLDKSLKMKLKAKS